MGEAEVYLHDLLEQDLQLATEILDTSHKLVVDVKATHYWVKVTLGHYETLMGIARNLNALLDALDGHWNKGVSLAGNPAYLKMWRTAAGLWRALPPLRSQYIEQLSRRRRQRIMGEELEEPEDQDQDEVKQEESRLLEYYAQLKSEFAELSGRISAVPAGLVPPPPPQEKLEQQHADAHAVPHGQRGNGG